MFNYKLKKMKNLFCFICFMFFTLSSYAQFTATKDGVKTLDGKNFYVVEIPGKTANDLYKLTNAFIISNFKNPNAVSNTLENEMINLHGTYPQAFICKKVLGVNIFANIDMNLIIYFKDGKVRFDTPNINSMYYNNEYQVRFSGGVNVMGEGDINMFKKNGKINKKDCVDNFNSFINSFISQICDYLKGNNSTNEDW
jgi:hypothetical protein